MKSQVEITRSVWVELVGTDGRLCVTNMDHMCLIFVFLCLNVCVTKSRHLFPTSNSVSMKACLLVLQEYNSDY